MLYVMNIQTLLENLSQHLSNRKIASLVGVHPTTIGRLRTGKVNSDRASSKTIRALELLAINLGVK